MVGRSERLEMRRAVDHWKARTLDFSRILHKPTVPREVKTDLPLPAGARPRGRARRDDPDPALPARAREPLARLRDPSDPERQPGRRDDARQRGDAAVRAGGAARGHHPPEVPGFGRPELRGVRPAGHHPLPRRGRQRLRRQGALGRQDRRLSRPPGRRSSRRRT